MLDLAIAGQCRPIIAEYSVNPRSEIGTFQMLLHCSNA